MSGIPVLEDEGSGVGQSIIERGRDRDIGMLRPLPISAPTQSK